jgi:hypothetical protein
MPIPLYDLTVDDRSYYVMQAMRISATRQPRWQRLWAWVADVIGL